MKIISVDRAKCNGCGLCQSACALAKKHKSQPSQARIRIRRVGGRYTEYVTFCQHCAEPVCMTACLKGIIDKEPVTGVVSRETEKCFACAACSVLCPMDAVLYDVDMDAYVTCDMCGGDPICVKMCPTGALSYGEPSRQSAALRQKNAMHMFMEGRS